MGPPPHSSTFSTLTAQWTEPSAAPGHSRPLPGRAPPKCSARLVGPNTPPLSRGCSPTATGLSASFDLRTAPLGAYTLTVVTPGADVVRADAVTVSATSLTNLSLDVTGPTAVRLNGLGRYSLTVHNGGTIDALEVPVAAMLPTSVQVVVDPESRAEAAAVIDEMAAPSDGSAPSLTAKV